MWLPQQGHQSSQKASPLAPFRLLSLKKKKVIRDLRITLNLQTPLLLTEFVTGISRSNRSSAWNVTFTNPGVDQARTMIDRLPRRQQRRPPTLSIRVVPT